MEIIFVFHIKISFQANSFNTPTNSQVHCETKILKVASFSKYKSEQNKQFISWSTSTSKYSNKVIVGTLTNFLFNLALTRALLFPHIPSSDTFKIFNIFIDNYSYQGLITAASQVVILRLLVASTLYFEIAPPNLPSLSISSLKLHVTLLRIAPPYPY